MCSTPHAPAACKYSPLGSCQASRSPKSPVVRGSPGRDNAFGRAPLTGTSHNRELVPPGPQDARIVPLSHQRTGPQVATAGTGSCLISGPRVLTSLTPWLAPDANSVQDRADIA